MQRRTNFGGSSTEDSNCNYLFPPSVLFTPACQWAMQISAAQHRWDRTHPTLWTQAQSNLACMNACPSRCRGTHGDLSCSLGGWAYPEVLKPPWACPSYSFGRTLRFTAIPRSECSTIPSCLFVLYIRNRIIQVCRGFLPDSNCLAKRLYAIYYTTKASRRLPIRRHQPEVIRAACWHLPLRKHMPPWSNYSIIKLPVLAYKRSFELNMNKGLVL